MNGTLSNLEHAITTTETPIQLKIQNDTQLLFELEQQIYVEGNSVMTTTYYLDAGTDLLKWGPRTKSLIGAPLPPNST